MAEITAQAVKALRDQTGAGMMDCKRVLLDAEGDLKRAGELLRERGLAKAGKREGRATSEGADRHRRVSKFGGRASSSSAARRTSWPSTDEVPVRARRRAGARPWPRMRAWTPRTRCSTTPRSTARRSEDRVTAAIAKLGENIVIKRAERVGVDGSRNRGRLRARRRQARRARRPGRPRLPGAEFSRWPRTCHARGRGRRSHAGGGEPRRRRSPDLLEKPSGSIYRNQAAQEGKPEKVIDRIVEGKDQEVRIKEIALVDQSLREGPRSLRGKELLGDVGRTEPARRSRVAGFKRFRLGESSEA